MSNQQTAPWVHHLIPVLLSGCLLMGGFGIKMIWAASQTVSEIHSEVHSLSDRMTATRETSNEEMRSVRERLAALELVRTSQDTQLITLGNSVAAMQVQVGAMQSDTKEIRSMLLRDRQRSGTQ